MQTMLLRADDAKSMEDQAARQLKMGWDLYGPLITAHKFMIAQWMVQTYPYHEYRLVSALNLSELERDVMSLQADGFDFFHFTQDWNGVMFQWMCRSVSYDSLFGKALNSTYNIVERSEPTLRLVPNLLAGAPPLVVEGGRVVEVSSRLHRSTG